MRAGSHSIIRIRVCYKAEEALNTLESRIFLTLIKNFLPGHKPPLVGGIGGVGKPTRRRTADTPKITGAQL
jgi:hypothetical protein